MIAERKTMQNRTAPITVGLLAAISLTLIPVYLNAGSPAIPWSQIGAKAGADYRGDGLAVSPTAEGARLRCVFQRLGREGTRGGCWVATPGADCRGDGLPVSPTAEGARLRCVFQRLEGEATREGLWLTSTVTNRVSDRFRLVAAAVGGGGGR